MSDLDTLIVTFQTQLSDVMETVVKTAMHEVTRLVKDGFLEEMKRRSQEVMSLRLQLQWAEKKLTGQGGEEGEKTGRCVDCAQMDVELSSDTTEGRSKDQHNNVMRSCAVKIEGSSAERWTGDHRQEVISQEPQKADNPAATDSPEREPQATEEEDAMEEKDVIDKLPLSSSHLIGWSSTLDDSHTGPRHLLRCGQCGKCFPHPSNLKAHLQTHTGERPFCCSLCGRSFTKLSNLKAHRRVHTGERPYCCVACGKRFTQKCNLKRHQRIHLDSSGQHLPTGNTTIKAEEEELPEGEALETNHLEEIR
ncbi:hypothetical protein INR49_025758, partial [Caranx melampygus]